MSELRSTVESLRAESLADLPDARIEEDFAELHRAVEQLELERLRRLAEIERRGLHERDGHLSVASWLAKRFKVARGAAREHVRLARALREMPETRRALEEGDLSISAARMLVSARDADPTAFSGSETELEAALIHQVGDLARITEYWREAAEREHAADGEEKIRERRRLYASATFLGMVRIDGDMDPEGGETLLTALRAYLDAESRSGRRDDRSPAQRRADALADICRQWLGSRGPAQRGRAETARDGYGGRRGARRRVGWPVRGRPRGPGELRDGPRARVRRPGDAGRDGRTLRAAGCGTADPGDLPGDAPGGGDPGPALPVPRL